MLKKGFTQLLITFSAMIFAFNSHAVLIGGVEFPDGEISFADSIISFAPGGDTSGLHAATQYPANALGIPDYSSVGTCNTNNAFECDYVTLGEGGTLIVSFVDNVLTGSGDTDFDLWIFEVGSDVEDTYVEISVDGTTWEAVGKVSGSTSGIDIDAYGFGVSSEFQFVKLIDDPLEGQRSGDGAFVGADIDAVGAISTRFVPTVDVSTPHMTALLALALLSVFVRRVKNY